MPETSRVVDQRYELTDVDTLKEHPDNPRRGDVSEIAGSIDRHGFYGAVIVQASTGYVLAGNHRLRAARQEGISQVPTIYVDVDDGTARRILLADNRLGEIATWDYEALAGVLGDLKSVDDDLRALGWADHELEALLGAEWRPKAGDTDLEDFTNDRKGWGAGQTITMDDEQWAIVSEAMDRARDGIDVPDGQALASICAEWMDR